MHNNSTGYNNSNNNINYLKKSIIENIENSDNIARRILTTNNETEN